MAEPQKMVHLSPVQRKRKKFSHPLTDNASLQLTEKGLNILLETYFENRSVEIGKKLMVSYFRLLRSTVARYLYHWPVTRRFLDEMVSAGAEAIIRVIAKLQPEQLRGWKGGEDENNSKAIGGLIENAIRHSIETTINNLRGVIPASERTNRGRETRHKNPIYGTINVDLSDEAVQKSQGYVDLDLFIFEIKDALDKITSTVISKKIASQENWGLSNLELGKKLGISSRWVRSVRNKLRKKYLKLGEKNA